MSKVTRQRSNGASPDIRQRVVDFRRVPARDLRAHPENWRQHPKAQRDALSGVLREIGFAGALLTRQTEDGGLELIDGHLRQDVAGDTPVPVLVTDLTAEEARYLLAVHDPLAAMAERDEDRLRGLLDTVTTDDAAVRALLDSLSAEGAEAARTDVDAEPQIDKAEELRVKWGVESGQLWQLGEHRLLCGDSAQRGNVERVMAGDRAACVFTDPPYGVAIGAKNRLLNSVQKAGRCLTDIKDDALSPEDLKAKLLPAFVNVRELAMAEDCTVFVTAPQGGELGMMMMMMMQEAGLRVRHVLIWKKNAPTFSMGRLDYDYQHEPILLTWGKRHKRPMGGTHKTSVWEIDKPRASAEHPTMKPVALVVNGLLNNSDAGDVVFEPYSGSGTAILACEQTGRRCRAIEIAPGYVAVALQRWADATGKTPTLLPA